MNQMDLKIGAVGFAFWILAETAAYAATLEVGADATYTTIQDAVDAAVDGDTLVLAAEEFSEKVVVSGINLTIVGAGQTETIVDTDGESAAWSVYGGALEVQDVGFVGNGGDSGGAIYATNGSLLTFLSCIFEENDATNGGAIYLDGGATMAASGSYFWSNYAEESGGAVYATGVGDSLSFDECEFDDNTAGTLSGAAIYVETEVDLDVSNSTFSDGYAYYYGGAIAATDLVNVNITDSIFQDNFSRSSGGAIFFYYPYGVLNISGSIFSANETQWGHGAGIYAYYYADLTMSDSIFEGNQTTYNGGGVYHYYGALTVTDVLFDGNSADAGPGGGLYTYYPGQPEKGLVSITGVQFWNNHAYMEGGGLHLRSAQTETILDDLDFVGNTSDSYGGGAYVMGPYDLTVTHSRFASNSAMYGGAVYEQSSAGGADYDNWTNNLFVDNWASECGAICLISGEKVKFINNTFAGNGAIDDAGVLGLYDVTLDFINNIVSSTWGGEAIVSYDINTAFYIDVSYNAWWDSVDGLVGGELYDDEFSDFEGNVFVDPDFATWSTDSDPDNDSFVLDRDSPLIDAGDPIWLDPDESPSDIGAYGGPAANNDDLDADGYTPLTGDCDDADASAHPGATDTWYDGVNSDCESGSDYDVDGDGEDAEIGGGIDCDDQDASIVTDCSDGPEADGGDTGEESVAPGTKQGCGCASARPTFRWWWMTLLVIVVGRRYSRTPGRASTPGK